jgi:hypothetical protein
MGAAGRRRVGFETRRDRAVDLKPANDGEINPRFKSELIVLLDHCAKIRVPQNQTERQQQSEETECDDHGQIRICKYREELGPPARRLVDIMALGFFQRLKLTNDGQLTHLRTPFRAFVVATDTAIAVP